eukprot:4298045-Prymnesium_polylepis.2
MQVEGSDALPPGGGEQPQLAAQKPLAGEPQPPLGVVVPVGVAVAPPAPPVDLPMPWPPAKGQPVPERTGT